MCRRMLRTRSILLHVTIIAAAMVMACANEETSITMPLDGASVDSTTTVYYASNRGKRYDIWVLPNFLTDTTATRLTKTVGYDSWWPRMSPRKSQLLFYRSPAKDSAHDYSGAELWMMKPDGSGEARLIAQNENGWQAQGGANWSPDGAHIVMMAWATGGGCNIYVTDSAGKNPARVNGRNAYLFMPSYSPDGRRIVCCGYPAGVSVGDGHEIEIITMKTDGSEEMRLTNDSIYDWNPVWSPDGQEIAFSSFVDSTGSGGLKKWIIRAVRPDGTGLRTIAGDGAANLYPRWSTRSSHLYLQRSIAGVFRLMRVARDGTGLMPVPHTGGLGIYHDQDPEPVVK